MQAEHQSGERRPRWKREKNALIHVNVAISSTRKADGAEDEKLLSDVVFCLAAFVHTSGTSAGSTALLTTLRS